MDSETSMYVYMNRTTNVKKQTCVSIFPSVHCLNVQYQNTDKKEIIEEEFNHIIYI